MKVYPWLVLTLSSQLPRAEPKYTVNGQPLREDFSPLLVSDRMRWEGGGGWGGGGDWCNETVIQQPNCPSYRVPTNQNINCKFNDIVRRYLDVTNCVFLSNVIEILEFSMCNNLFLTRPQTIYAKNAQFSPKLP